MSSVFRRGDIYFAKVRTSSGKWIARTTGTRDKALAKSMGHMLDQLGLRGKQAWDLMDEVVNGSLDLSRLYRAYSSNQLDRLREQLSDMDVSPLVEDWLTYLKPRLRPDTVEHYETHVRSLIPKDAPFQRSELTFERLSGWLSRLDVSPGTRRKYHAAMSGFCKYLRSRGVLRENPVRDVKAPAPSKPRDSVLEHAEVVGLLDSMEEPYRTLSALMHGTGMEVSVALALTRKDIDVEHGEIRARGTKTKARDRVVSVEPWALKYLRKHCRHMLPDARVFPGVNRWTASDKHREACKAAGIENYQLRDSRHTFAVRAIKAGASFEVVARQLGHADTAMVVRVYGRYRPSPSDMREWHRVAAAQDKRRAAR